jgi:adenylate cyclase
VSETGIGMNEAVNQHIPLSVASKKRLTIEERTQGSAIEQREVTVAFADIRGFTTLADCMPPEELAVVLNTYLSAVTKIFLKHDVMINRFGGDSIMAVWNAPADCEGHALRATMAASEAQRAIHELQKTESTLPKIDFGIGVNTGRIIAGNIGYEEYREYSILGDTVNIAAKLTSVTPGGKVWITADTFELVKDHISVKPLVPLALRGKRQPVKAYEVLGMQQV